MGVGDRPRGGPAGGAGPAGETGAGPRRL